MYILLTETAEETKEAEWIRTYTVLDNPDPTAKKKTVTRFGYVPRSQVILDTDFRRVVGCWPVRYVHNPEGGFEGSPTGAYFTLTGVGTAWNNGLMPAVDPEWDRVERDAKKDYGEQHTYYAEGVFTVRHEKYSNRHLYSHGTIDYPNKKTATYAGSQALKSEPEPGPEEIKRLKAQGELAWTPGVAWFPPEALKGCKEIPTLDPNSRASNPTEHKKR